MTRQALDHFEESGVDMHDVALKLTGRGKAYGADMHASAREFMAEADPATAAENMRTRRDETSAGVKQARQEFKARQKSGVMRYAGQDVASTEAKRDPRVNAARLKKSQDLIGLFEGMY
jgi:hypothetical protein